ncbi:MAG: DNA methyltransferase [Rhodospirillales bacterium]
MEKQPSQKKHHNERPWLDRRLIEKVEYVSVEVPKVYEKNPRAHSKRQRRKLDASIEVFGVVVPILLDNKDKIVAGEALFLSAERLGYTEVPVTRIHHLSDEAVKALRIALNRIGELGDWDEAKLAAELSILVDVGFEVELSGFETAEIDFIIEGQGGSAASSLADETPALEKLAVTQRGDLWYLDDHRVLYGNAREPASYSVLMGGALAQMVISDFPYNCKVNGHVSGSGKHQEFIEASGEMNPDEYRVFVRESMANLVAFSDEGSLHYLFTDWRQLPIFEAVGGELYDAKINLAVWAKPNGGMGSMYRSRHELIPVFKKGKGSHINNVELGRFGRNRTNVWEYEGCNSFSAERRADLALHPTPKPVALIADAIKDASKRGGLVLDPFLGSGTTVIACEETGRICAGMELDPLYVDVIIRRWETFTGGEARHAETGMTFREMDDYRNGETLLLAPPAKDGKV